MKAGGQLRHVGGSRVDPVARVQQQQLATRTGLPQLDVDAVDLNGPGLAGAGGRVHVSLGFQSDRASVFWLMDVS